MILLPLRISATPARPRRPSRLRPPALALLLLLATSGFASASPTPVPPAPVAEPNLAARIPEVSTLSFSGDLVNLPSMLVGGKVAILILGFTKGARTQATLWGRRLPTDYLYSTDVLYFEMPVLESIPRVLRGAVLRAIKADVSLRSQSHFAPLTNDEKRWRSLVHFREPNDAYVLLVDSSGLVQAQLQGAPTDATYQELKRRVDQLRTSPAR